MKRILSIALAVIIALACFSAAAEEAKTRTKFWIPEKLAEIEVDELPVSEFPLVKTKTANGWINVSVTPEPDALFANWMGYGEEPEKVELKDGTGKISQEGHHYQLGAKYDNSWWKNWIDAVDYVEEDEASSYEEAVAYFRKAYAQEIADGALIDNEPFLGFYVYYFHMSYYITGEGDNIEVHEIGSTVMEKASDYFPTLAEAEALAEEMGTIEVKEEESAEYKTTVYTLEGHNTNRAGGYAWLYTVEYGHSRGKPNRAYTLMTGEYAVDYTRAGVPNYASRTTKGKDFFETGIEGATSVVNWEIGKKKNRILSISTVYPEGSELASIRLDYPRSGNFYHYTVTYNAGEGEQYVATYSAKDQLIKAYYIKDGKTVAANSSATKWINCETNREEHFLEPLNGELLGHPAHVYRK